MAVEPSGSKFLTRWYNSFNGLSCEISNWCLSPSGKITMTRVNSSDLSLFVGGGFVASSGSGCGSGAGSSSV